MKTINIEFIIARIKKTKKLIIQLLKSFKKSKIIIEDYKWGVEAMEIKIIFPNSFVQQFDCAYSEQFAEFPPAKKFIQDTLVAT